MKFKHPEIWQSMHPEIWQSIHDLDFLREIYDGWDLKDEEQLVPIHERFIDISTTALCNHLGVPDVPHASLTNFITWPSYMEIRHTLCGVNSNATWVHDKRTRSRIKFPNKKLNLAAKVWLKLINTRLLPCDPDKHIGRDKVYLLYFLMK